MEDKNTAYKLKVSELFAVAASVGGLHYTLKLIENRPWAMSLDGIMASADVGITAASGVLAYCVYRYFRPRSP